MNDKKIDKSEKVDKYEKVNKAEKGVKVEKVDKVENVENIEKDEKDEKEINNKQYILDPLSVIIKLSILSKKTSGSKICIYNNVLFIHENNMLQPFIRYIYKNNKNNIQYLYNPIYIACNNYLTESFIKDHPYIKKIFMNAQKGLKELINTYSENTIIVHALYYYYNIIESYLTNKSLKNAFIDDYLTQYYTEDVIKKISSVWNTDKIKIILELCDYLDRDYQYSKNIKCLEEFMIIIDDDIKKNIV